MIEEVKVVSHRFDIPNSHILDTILSYGAYRVLPIGLSMKKDSIMDMIVQSGLRGKGGGGALAGEKWLLMPTDSIKPSYLVVNCDESEPGTFKDRQIITKDPHLLIEGIILTSYAISANAAYIYIRGEYQDFEAILQKAIDDAYEKGYLGDNIIGKNFNLDITIHRGAGAYICGEKSALLESLEGKRGHPRLKPKEKEPEWYFGNPTLVNNVETITSVPFIIENRAAAYRRFGTEHSSGSMLFALSGHVEKAGIHEVAFGTPMLEFINQFGGGIKDGKRLKAVIPGGSSTPILTADEVAIATLDYETLRSLGSSLGTGGMIVMDEDTDMVEALKNLLEFYHEESCGQCTPCREGTGLSDTLLKKILTGKGTSSDIDKLLDLADIMNGKTICVFAPAVSGVIQSFISKFRNEFEGKVERKGGVDGY
ncbi:MAG: NADH-quinone oxidoreductase subunit NuoF [Sulfurovum sp.]|nr:NADH-quinone oxidoreductase subunit NuoF [Sulfurovaceae bacterium]